MWRTSRHTHSHNTLPDQRSYHQGSAHGTVVIICPGGLEHGGGIGRQMGYFLRALADRAPASCYRVVDSRGPWFLGASPRCIALSGVYLGGAILKLLAARLFATPCVAHINITGRGSTTRKVILTAFAHAAGLRYILHVHDYNYADEYNSRGTLMRALVGGMFRRAAKVLVLGTRDQQVLSTLLQLPRDGVIVLPNAVPDPRPTCPREPRSGEPCRLLFLGHLSERKGVPELLRALASPALASQDWRATLAGGGPIDEFRRLAMDLDIIHRVDFPGWVDQSRVDALCSEADVLVLPSHAEGLAMAVLEGLSHGLAVITTPVGAHAEVIEAEESGLLVPPGDVDSLAEALRRVVDDIELRQRLRARARRRFLEKFDVRTYAERLADIHVSLLPSQVNVGPVAAEVRSDKESENCSICG